MEPGSKSLNFMLAGNDATLLRYNIIFRGYLSIFKVGLANRLVFATDIFHYYD